MWNKNWKKDFLEGVINSYLAGILNLGYFLWISIYQFNQNTIDTFP